jgi:hypothetical protein
MILASTPPATKMLVSTIGVTGLNQPKDAARASC